MNNSKKSVISAEYQPLIDQDKLEENIDKGINDDNSLLPLPTTSSTTTSTTTMKMKQSPTKKRNDLQCWRTIAIIGVLLFHIFPKTFPNGFLGVDIFFVLSGFLMSTIIHKQKSKINLNLSVDFYYRRIKRIVPIYLLIILIVLYILMNVIWEDEYVKIKKDAKYSLLFITNLQDLIHQRDYFDTDNNYPFFKHCWSLSVEMQFYLIVPFMFYLWLNVFKNFKFLIIFIVFISSLAYQCLITSEIIRYESMFCRIWQFSCGILAESYKIPYKNNVFYTFLIQVVFFTCIMIEFLPKIELNRQMSSVICVVLASVLISASKSDSESPFKFLLKNDLLKNFMVFCGDFSYVLYLIHWPLITYFRFVKSGDDFTVFEGTILVLACLMLSIIAHLIIENPMIKHCNSKKRLIIISLIMYLVCTHPLLSKSTVNTNDDNNNDEDDSMNVDYSTKNTNQSVNQDENYVKLFDKLHLSYFSGYKVSTKTFEMFRRILDFKHPLILPDGWSTKNEIEFAQKTIHDTCATWNYNCRDTYKKWTKIPRQSRFTMCESSLFKNGKYKAAVIGNSHSQCGAGAIHMNPLFKKVITLSAHGCQFPEENKMTKDCKNANRAIIDIIKKFKPDFVFIITSWNGKTVTDDVKHPIKDDYGVQILQNLLNELSQYTDHIIMNKPNFRFTKEIAPEYIRRKNQKTSIDFKYSRKTIMVRQNSVIKGTERLQALECSKCIYFDYQEALCGDNYCNAIDEDTGLPLLRDYGHINILGVRKFYPILDKYVKKALKISQK